MNCLKNKFVVVASMLLSAILLFVGIVSFDYLTLQKCEEYSCLNNYQKSYEISRLRLPTKENIDYSSKLIKNFAKGEEIEIGNQKFVVAFTDEYGCILESSKIYLIDDNNTDFSNYIENIYLKRKFTLIEQRIINEISYGSTNEKDEDDVYYLFHNNTFEEIHGIKTYENYSYVKINIVIYFGGN